MTADEAFGPSGRLPTADEAFGPDPAAKPAPEPAGTAGLVPFLTGAARLLAKGLAGTPGSPNVGAAVEQWGTLSPDQKESVKAYGPTAALTAGSMAIPGGPLVQGAVNVGVNSAVDAYEAYRQGDPDWASAAIPKADLRTAIAATAPAAVKYVVAPALRGAGNFGRSVYRGLTAPSLADGPIGPDLRVSSRLLPGEELVNETIERAPGQFEFAPDIDSLSRIDAPLRPLPELPVAAAADDLGAFPMRLGLPAPDDATAPLSGATPEGRRGLLRRAAEAVRSDAQDQLNNVKGVRTKVSAPVRFLRRSDNEVARAAGLRGEELTFAEERLRQNSQKWLAETFDGIDEAGRKEVTRLLDGSKAMEDASSPEVARAAQRMRDYYQQWATVNRREGLFTKTRKTGEFTPFEPIPENYSPRIPAESPWSAPPRLRGIFKRQTTAFSRAPGEFDDPTQYLDDALEIGKQYADKYSKLVGTARTFGSATGAVNKSDRFWSPSYWGKEAQAIYRELQSTAPVEAEMFKVFMDDVYTGQRDIAGAGLNAINSRVTQSLLGGSWATQLGQMATPIRQYGLGNTVEGMLRYRRDPYLRALIDSSGVRDAGWSELISGNTGMTGYPIKAITGVERFLRGPLNAGVVPYLEDLAGKVDSGPITKAVEKQLDELMVDPEALADGITPSLLRDAIQASGRRTQFHPGVVGQQGHYFQTGLGKMMTALQPYGWSAWQSMQDDVLEPLLSRDSSLRALGASRLSRGLAAGVGAEGLREVLASLIRAREPSGEEAMANLLGTQFGTPGQVLGNRMWHPETDIRFNVMPPVYSVGSEVVNDLWDGNYGDLAVNLGAIADKTGTVSMLRPTLRGLMREDRK